MQDIVSSPAHCLPSRILQVAVHLLVSTATTFLAALIVLNFIDLHTPLPVVLVVTLVCNAGVLTAIEIICLLRHCAPGPTELNTPQRLDWDSELKEAEEGRRVALVLWEL
ncbi:hypothetical protein C8R47DRAFT_1323581 [Mycena vitilis]|nr:hypothetical protein C8R47DRAFT_1323581 [Mycena vitilis]